MAPFAALRVTKSVADHRDAADAPQQRGAVPLRRTPPGTSSAATAVERNQTGGPEQAGKQGQGYPSAAPYLQHPAAGREAERADHDRDLQRGLSGVAPRWRL
jgi:hypothetical protein